jgi:hypothetical protein
MPRNAHGLACPLHLQKARAEDPFSTKANPP